MAHLEFTPRPELKGFQHQITYAVPDLAPQKVVPTTQGVFDLYFRGVEFDDAVGGVVMRDGVQFLVNARRGLADDPFLIERMFDTPYRDLMKAIHMEGDANTPPDESREAAAFSIIAMGALPRVAKIYVRDFEGKNVRFPHSPTGMLRSPMLVAELTERLDELVHETKEVAQGKAPRAVHIYRNQGLLRTKEYWKTGAKLVARKI